MGKTNNNQAVDTANDIEAAEANNAQAVDTVTTNPTDYAMEAARRREEADRQKKEKREAMLGKMSKIPQELMLLSCQVNTDGDKVGLLLIEGTQKDGKLNIPMPDKKKTPLVSGWMPITAANAYLIDAAPLTMVPCLLGVQGNFVMLLDVISKEAYAQIRSLLGNKV